MPLALITETLHFSVVIVDIFSVEVAWFALFFVQFKQIIWNIEHCERLRTIFLTFQLCKSPYPSFLDTLICKCIFAYFTYYR